MSLLARLKSYISEIKEDEIEALNVDLTQQENLPALQQSERAATPRRLPLPEPVPALEKIEIFRPGVFDDCQHIADALKQGSAVIVDYYYTLESTAKRIRIFMSGFVLASEGCEEKISTDICLYMPRHAGIQNHSRQLELEKALQIPWKGSVLKN